jgi:hypothetical protein
LAYAFRSSSAFLTTVPTRRNTPPLTLTSRVSSRLLSSFQASPPPGTHGTPVFPDIDFAVASDSASEGFKRRTDKNAVFVVTGANRGIGLQFVRSLIDRTQVSDR